VEEAHVGARAAVIVLDAVQEVVDAVLDVVGEVPDLVPPLLVEDVGVVLGGELLEQSVHAPQLLLQGDDLFAHALELGVLLLHQGCELAEEGAQHPRRNANHGVLHHGMHAVIFLSVCMCAAIEEGRCCWQSYG